MHFLSVMEGALEEYMSVSVSNGRLTGDYHPPVGSSIREPDIHGTAVTVNIGGTRVRGHTNMGFVQRYASRCISNQGSADEQIRGTCGLCATGSAANYMTGSSHTEADVIQAARGNPLTGRPTLFDENSNNADERGGTTPTWRASLYRRLTGEHMNCLEMGLDDVADLAHDGHGVIITVCPEHYDSGYSPGGRHAVNLIDYVTNDAGDRIGYIIVDSNGSDGPHAIRYIPRVNMLQSWSSANVAHGTFPSHISNVTVRRREQS